MTIEKDGEVFKRHCFCGTIHVHTGTKVIACLGLVLHGLSLLVGLKSLGHTDSRFEVQHDNEGNSTIFMARNHHMHSASGLTLSIIWILVLVSLLYGVTKRKPSYYYPYFIINAFVTLLWVIVVVVYIGIAIFVLVGTASIGKDFLPVGGAIAFTILAIMAAGFFALYFYFCLIVVNRSKKLLDAELDNPLPVTYHPNYIVQPYPSNSPYAPHAGPPPYMIDPPQNNVAPIGWAVKQ